MTREQELIKKIKEWTGAGKIGDDCAVLAGQGLVSSDMLVEGRHFDLRYTDFASLGYKSCAVNLSDIAAMAGRPRYLTVALSLPDYVTTRQLQSFYQGFVDCARSHRTEIVGGDLTGGDKFVIAVTAIGEAYGQGVLLRSGAREGDIVFVSGNFGASALGLRILAHRNSLSTAGSSSRRQEEAVIGVHLRPEPRLREARRILEVSGGRAALMDASDGLADALVQICQASGVFMQVNAELIPTTAETRELANRYADSPESLDNALHLALYGGEDYELVGSCTSAVFDELAASVTSFKGEAPIVAIGKVVAAKEPGRPLVELLTANGGPSSAPNRVSYLDLDNCYKHFS